MMPPQPMYLCLIIRLYWTATFVGCELDYLPIISALRFPIPNPERCKKPPSHPEIEAAVLRAAGRLAELGADIVENVPMPHNRFGIPAYFVVSRVEAASNLHRFDGVKYGYRTSDPVSNLQEMYRKSRAQGFGLQPKLRVLMGMYVGAAQYDAQYYNRALRVRSLIRSDFEKIFDPNGDYRLNLLLTATTPSSAFPIGDIYGDFCFDAIRRPVNRSCQPRRRAGNFLPRWSGLTRHANRHPIAGSRFFGSYHVKGWKSV